MHIRKIFCAISEFRLLQWYDTVAIMLVVHVIDISYKLFTYDCCIREYFILKFSDYVLLTNFVNINSQPKVAE